MNMLQILQKPVITEKTYKLMEMNQYVFFVHPKADKEQIKSAFQTVFGVQVQSVNLIKIKRKKKRLGKFLGHKPGGKKAIITLKPGQDFNLLKEDDQGQTSKDTTVAAKTSIFDRFRKVFSTELNDAKISEARVKNNKKSQPKENDK